MGLCNGAMAKLKVGEPEGAKFDCGKALEVDPTNIKALFRRGKAKLAMGEYDAAADDAARVLELDSTNKEAETMKRQAEQEKKKQKQKEKAMCSKMFGGSSGWLVTRPVTRPMGGSVPSYALAS